MSGVDNGRVEGISASGNGGVGISATDSTITNCTASNNGGHGIFGNESFIIYCTVDSNGGHGITGNFRCSIVGCGSSGNTLAGIAVGAQGLIINCSTSVNGDHGIFANTSTITDCTSDGNLGTGISANSGSRVSGCIASHNDLDGIVLISDCVAENNNCDSNGLGPTITGAGIRATGSDNRIEANNCTDSDFGIQCSAAGNIIIRNTCSGNTTNWSLVANNVYGPIIDRTAPGSPAVNGNAAADASGSTHPNANFSY